MTTSKKINKGPNKKQTKQVTKTLQSTSNLCDAFSGKDSKIKSSSDLGWLDLAFGGNRDGG
jgi:hypothetical protein